MPRMSKFASHGAWSGGRPKLWPAPVLRFPLQSCFTADLTPLQSPFAAESPAKFKNCCFASSVTDTLGKRGSCMLAASAPHSSCASASRAAWAAAPASLPLLLLLLLLLPGERAPAAWA